MVFSSARVARVATVSADLCQYIACNPQRLSSSEVLDLLCCLPLYHLRRLALCLFSFFCFPPDHLHPYHYRRSSSSSSSSSSSYDSDGYDSHSD
ncbi:uncharacterized protein LOC120266514 [Dioscorea cayenensis subsp. rotundata]|uniref:Uncharacterized protein LOC120266514 n=1 Tax=Dioscorea cayennensis subsp. rotundata TaxID=55577 RepID=A0AB40BRN5_DIOCR|nr:uncharacterized protein LOC120266514 [Dioscorea cayenensis subsp. rotundata]